MDLPRTPTPPVLPSSDVAPSPLAMTPTSAPQSQSHLFPPRATLSTQSSFNSTASATLAPTTEPSSHHTSFTSFTTAPTPYCPPVAPSLSAAAAADAYTPLSASSINALDLPALRHRLLQAQALISNLHSSISSLHSSLSSLRTTAAHYQLQHKLLLLETAEARARSQVEADILSAQVDVLRGQDRRKLKRAQRRWREVWAENQRLRAKLRNANPNNRVMESSPEDVRASAVVNGDVDVDDGSEEVDEEEEDEEEREHERMEIDAVSTSNPHEINHPARSSQTAPPTAAPEVPSREAEEDHLAALGRLASAASHVLSQEALSHPPSPARDRDREPPPSTPRRRKPQHLALPIPTSSLPPTSVPSSQRLGSASLNPKPTLLSPVAFTAPVDMRRKDKARGRDREHVPGAGKRRRSRDSTISVSDDEALGSVAKRRRPRPEEPHLHLHSHTSHPHSSHSQPHAHTTAAAVAAAAVSPSPRRRVKRLTPPPNPGSAKRRGERPETPISPSVERTPTSSQPRPGPGFTSVNAPALR